MGLMDELRKLTRPYNEEEEEYDYDEEPEMDSEPAPAPAPAAPRRSAYTAPEPKETRRGPAKVVNLNNNSAMQVILVKPDRFDTVSEIADHLREKQSIVLNLESTNKDIARRLIDFLSGVAYALEGKIKRVATNAYIITPYNVDLMGENAGEIDGNSLRF